MALAQRWLRAFGRKDEAGIEPYGPLAVYPTLPER